MKYPEEANAYRQKPWRKVEAEAEWMADPGPLTAPRVVLFIPCIMKCPVLVTGVSCGITHLYLKVSVNKVDVLLPPKKRRERERDAIGMAPSRWVWALLAQETTVVSQHLFFVTPCHQEAATKNVEMLAEMQQDLVEGATQVLEKHNIEKDIAAQTDNEIDRK